MTRVYENILETIGNTPLVRLNSVTKDLPCPVYAKIEYGNPGNSIKDRMALKMIEVAEADGRLKPGGTIIEGTSGNTGMGLAIAAIIKGYKCIFTTTDKQSKEKADILRAMGAEVIVCPTDVAPEDPRSYYSVSKRLAEEVPNSWYVNQYDNLANRQAHYEQTGPEIWEQTDGRVTHLVVAAGTGGTVIGTGEYLKEQNPHVQVWAIDSYGSLLKKWWETGELDMNEVYPYISEGFGEDFVPANYKREVIDLFEKVTDKDGAVMARRISKEEGIFVGYSAGSVIAGLNQLKDKLKPEDFVVVIFHDHGSRYVGKIYNDEWMLEKGFLEVKTAKDLLGGRGRRVIYTVSPEDTVATALQLMQQHDISQVPVLDGMKSVGTLTQGGLLKRLSGHGHLRQMKVSQVMEAPLPEVSPETDIAAVRATLQTAPAVLLKDDSGSYHILTQQDLLLTIS